MKVYLPYRGEFGWRCMMHAPQVHADPGPKTVCVERGFEALYPSAERFHYVEPLPDADRRQRAEDDYIVEVAGQFDPTLDWDFVAPSFEAERAYFQPKPRESQLERDVDVVVCPRLRTYGPDKNWGLRRWDWLIEELEERGLDVFAAGTAGVSEPVRCHAAWHYPKQLDACIEAMHRCSCVVSTDNGLAHLAMMAGKPLILISHKEGLVAPGHDDVGKPYWPIKLERYERANHLNTSITIVHHSWENQDLLIPYVGGLLCPGE